MRIAFYAPLKSPDHPVPSGDRLMARLLMQAIRQAGHSVELASQLRSRASVPEAHEEIAVLARLEVERLTADWRNTGAPDIFFCYHLYYKAPDFIGPILARDFGIPYVVAEASMSPRRAEGPWANAEASIRRSIGAAALSICFTRRDRDGLLRIVPNLPTALLAPFIDSAPFTAPPLRSDPPRLMTVAMMRDGDKLESYRILAAALLKCAHLSWTLSVVGDGEARGEVEALFASLAGRVEWLGERAPEDVPGLLAHADLYVWPGVGEAYGLAYLEAQAAGLPVAAQAVAGVPEVVLDGRTGLLTTPGDTDAYAAALSRLITDAGLRSEMGSQARRFVHEERSLAPASARLQSLLERFERQ